MNSIKILYVEDEPFLGKIVKESLESRNFQVKMITDGALVLNAFKTFCPDVCVLDVMLPNKDGYTIGQEIRKVNGGVPILFLTAKDQTADLVRGFESGGNDYIRKPFSMEELIVRIKNLLHLTTGQIKMRKTTTSIPIGKYQFFPQSYELAFGNKKWKLSHRETELLKIMVHQQNLTIQRKDILHQIWGDDSFFNSRNLDVYIKKLRDYFKEDPSVKIVTLKGVGYHFTVE